jgi:protoporphyrinogen oxidase
MTTVETLIIGAGPTGLGAAWRLDAHGQRDWLVVEGAAVAGGLARSIVDDHGFTWDLGGHVQFSHYEYFDALMDDLLGPDGWYYHDRESWVWICGRFVPYPFQLNLHRLPETARATCVAGLEAASANATAREPGHFGDWIDATFGDGIAALFMRPYNYKVWAREPERMSWSWIGDRVAVVDLDRVRNNIRLGRDDVSWGPNNRFRFPKRGGTGAVWRALARMLEQRHPGRLQFRRRLVRLDSASRVAHFDGGGSIRYDRMLSTIPLDHLVRVSDVGSELTAAASDLEYSSTHVIGVGLTGRPGAHLDEKCWMYFPESNCPFYRVTHFSHYSPQNVPHPGRQWSLMAEVSESPHKPVDASRVVDDTLNGLSATGLIERRDEVHHTWHLRLERGYPVPSLNRDRALSALLPALESRHVYTRGRFGAWKYEVSNQDHSFAQGVELVDRWLTGAFEATLNMPEAVNARRPAQKTPNSQNPNSQTRSWELGVVKLGVGKRH